MIKKIIKFYIFFSFCFLIFPLVSLSPKYTLKVFAGLLLGLATEADKNEFRLIWDKLYWKKLSEL